MTARTALIINGPNYKEAGLVPFYYRWRNCDTNLTSNTPANQYQRQKIIQRTVRVPASLYTMNKGALTVFRPTSESEYNVCWNQQSDRPYPSNQKATIPSTYTTLSNKHTSNTSSRPGCQTPGGIGCDIKHNSYERYLNRMKGRHVLRRGAIPPTFGSPDLPFNRAYPVYGGKEFKTSIVSGCNCPIHSTVTGDTILYGTSSFDSINEVVFSYQVGQLVYAKETEEEGYVQAKITAILDSGVFQVTFTDGTSQTLNAYQIMQYFPCNCTYNTVNTSGDFNYLEGFTETCLYPELAIIKQLGT